MLNEQIIAIRDYILSKNTYFDEGIAMAYQDETAGIIDEKGTLFPDDSRGNYFYLRLPDNVSFSANNNFAISDCATAFGVGANVILVACVRNADPDVLMQNLANTIMFLPVYAKIPTDGIFKSEVVTRRELSFMSKENREAALQRIPLDYTIVSISFSVTSPVQLNNCIVDPCKTC